MRPTHSRGFVRRSSSSVWHNLFFALQPSDEIRAEIEATAQRLKSEHPASGRWVKSHRYHLTLRYLGAHGMLPEALVAAASDCGDRVRVPAFAFALDIAGSFANRSIPWWIGCGGMPPALDALWDAISTGLDVPGLPASSEERAPHVTILRDADRLLPATPIEPIAWPVEEFVLVDSLLGPQASHTVLRRWRLS
jgi:2'-5' RNA ligase